MTLQAICQLCIALRIISGFFVCVYHDFHGRPAVAPRGFFPGFISSCIAYPLIAGLFWLAGAFSELLP